MCVFFYIIYHPKIVMYKYPYGMEFVLLSGTLPGNDVSVKQKPSWILIAPHFSASFSTDSYHQTSLCQSHG
jgi:hypothetical protein